MIAKIIVGVLQVELIVDGSRSLKGKRCLVQSLKDRLHRDHQVSVAEAGKANSHRVDLLEITMASNSMPHGQSTLDRILGKIRRQRDCFLADRHTEILTGQ